jgi:hypothetical protein
MRTVNFLVIAFIVLLSLAGCRKIEQLPAVPYIEFRSFSIFDTIDILGNEAQGGRLTFYFEDGDGDLGLQEPTDKKSDSTNLFFTLYRKIDGEMVKAPSNDPLKPSAYRIPFMERLGQNKILKGTVEVTFLYLFYTDKDTIKYDFYLKDRALNESNVTSTCEIVVSKNKTYTF